MSQAKLDSNLKSDYSLRAMTEHDLLDVVGIEEASGLSRWGWEAYYDELHRGNTAMFVAEMRCRPEGANQVVGFIVNRFVADELHINNFAVRRNAQRCGVGGALLGQTLEVGARRGALTALLEVRADNRAAQRLYARFGFQIIGRRHNYYKDPPDDALLMSVSLSRNTA